MLGHKILVQILLKLLSAFLSFLATIFVARVFLPETIGEIAFLIGITSFALLFFDLGLKNTAKTKIAQSRFSLASNLGTLIYSKLALSLLYILVILGIFWINQEKIQMIGLPVFLVVAVALYLESFSITLQQYFVGQGHFYKFMLNNFLAETGGSLFLILICLWAPTKFNYAGATLIKSLTLIAILLWRFRKIKIDWQPPRAIFQNYWQYAKPFLILAPLSLLISSAERIILPYLITTFALGLFTIGLKLYQLAEIAKKTFTTFVYTYVCKISAQFKGGKFTRKLRDLTTLTQIYGAVLVVGLFNRASFLTILVFGETYAPAAIVTKLMCLFLYLQLILSNYTHLIYARAHHQKLIKVTVFGGLVLILGSLILIPERLLGIKLLGLEYAGMPLVKILHLLIPSALFWIILSRKIIGTAFLKTQLRLSLYFILYLLLDYFVLGLASENLLWVFVSWVLGIALFLAIMMKFGLKPSIKSEVKSLFSLKKFLQGLQETE